MEYNILKEAEHMLYRQHNLIPRNKTFINHIRSLISSSSYVINMFAKTKITVYKNAKVLNARNRRHSIIVWCKISIIKRRRRSLNKKPVWLTFIYFKLPNKSPLLNSIKCWENWVSIIDDVKNGVNLWVICKQFAGGRSREWINNIIYV